MKIAVLFSVLFFLSSSCIAPQMELKKVEPALAKLIEGLFEQEGVDPAVGIYDSGPDFHSLAAISFVISDNGLRLFMLVNQEKFKLLDQDEQVAVILHEIGHIKSNPYLGFVYCVAPLIMGITAGTYAMNSINAPSWNDFPKKVILSCAIGFSAKKLAEICCAWLSRREELAADAFAFLKQKKVDVFISLLEKRKQLFEKEYPDSFWARLFEDHPCAQERIAQLTGLDNQ
ncbi:hypothetical protein BH09DEP1_BH09DEP1_3950 [soil metagenome]